MLASIYAVLHTAGSEHYVGMQNLYVGSSKRYVSITNESAASTFYDFDSPFFVERNSFLVTVGAVIYQKSVDGKDFRRTHYACEMVNKDGNEYLV